MSELGAQLKPPGNLFTNINAPIIEQLSDVAIGQIKLVAELSIIICRGREQNRPQTRLKKSNPHTPADNGLRMQCSGVGNLPFPRGKIQPPPESHKWIHTFSSRLPTPFLILAKTKFTPFIAQFTQLKIFLENVRDSNENSQFVSFSSYKNRRGKIIQVVILDVR